MLGTREIALFHHTGCGMASCTSHSVRQRVKDNLPADRKDVVQVDGIDFLEFSDLEGSVKEDVEWLKVHPLILPGTVVTGWVYEVESGAVSDFLCCFLGTRKMLMGDCRSGGWRECYGPGLIGESSRTI